MLNIVISNVSLDSQVALNKIPLHPGKYPKYPALGPPLYTPSHNGKP